MSSTNDMRARIASELNRALTDGFGNSGETFATAVTREINSAIKHYESQRFRWNEVRESEFATTVSGTKTYSLPASFIGMDTLKLIYNGSYINPKKITWGEIEESDRDAAGNTKGIPSRWAIYGNVIRFFPIPNGAYTLVGSYVRRFLPVSVTGSYTAVVPLAGSYSLTVTTTASHNNRVNGWYQDGEELIRARAVAALQINYLKDTDAIAEARGLALNRENFLSVREKQAFHQLMDETADARSTGFIRPYKI